MADLSTCPPLTARSVHRAHDKIKPYIHHTPLLTSKTLDSIASHDGVRVRFFFKCENLQRIGAFKARGAFHAVLRLIDEVGLDTLRARGVVTHSSGNHAQALALAASSFGIPAHIVMPTISTPSKIAGTREYTPHVHFCGSTSVERVAAVAEVVKATGAILVPPYDHPDIMLGQGTAGLELHEQHSASSDEPLRAVFTPLGGGGLLSGTCIYYSDKPTLVFGVEPSFQGANDGERGLKADPPRRIETVKTLTIADGLRTPLGVNPWAIFTASSDHKPYLESVYSVSEQQIKDALRLVLERMKVVIEPSAAVPLAAVLYNPELRAWLAQQQQGEIWDIGVIFSGGNTTVEAIGALYGNVGAEREREAGKVGLDGKKVAENIAG